MARRGDELRDHIRWTAKDVFLELGFERASMDVVASRAATSKRSLYAHFESKEKLFLAVVELVRGLFLDRLGQPADYPGTPEQALTMFCARYLEGLIYEGSIQMFRLTAGETARFPAGAAQYHDVVFSAVEKRISAYLSDTFAASPSLSLEVAQKLLGLVLYPRLPRALFGLDRLAKTLEQTLSPNFELSPVRDAVDEAMQRLKWPGAGLRHQP